MAASLVENLGLDLPVYGPDTPIAWTKDDMRWAAQLTEKETFMRGVIIYAHMGATSLKETVRISDDMLGEIAENADTTLIGHDWALYDASGYGDIADYSQRVGVHDQFRRQDRLSGTKLLPKEHLLVAEVDVIRPSVEPIIAGDPLQLERPNPNQSLGISKAVDNHEVNAKRHEQPLWWDPGPGQFGSGYCPRLDKSGLFLVDIEPYFCIVPD